MNYTLKTFKSSNPKSSNKANVVLTIDNAFVVNGINVREGEKGLYVTMPQYKNKDEEYKSLANPVTANSRKKLFDDILNSYKFLSNNPERSSFIQENDESKEPLSYRVTVYNIPNPQGTTKAMAQVVINDEFAINNIQIKEGKYGDFVNMPSYKNKNGEFVNIISPTETFKKDFNESVIYAYDCLRHSKENKLIFDFKSDQTVYPNPRTSNPVYDYLNRSDDKTPKPDDLEIE